MLLKLSIFNLHKAKECFHFNCAPKKMCGDGKEDEFKEKKVLKAWSKDLFILKSKKFNKLAPEEGKRKCAAWKIKNKLTSKRYGLVFFLKTVCTHILLPYEWNFHYVLHIRFALL